MYFHTLPYGIFWWYWCRVTLLSGQKIDPACFQLYAFHIYKNVIYVTCPVYEYPYVLITHALSHRRMHITAGRFFRMWQTRNENSRVYTCKLGLRTTRLPKTNYAWIRSEILVAMTKTRAILPCVNVTPCSLVQWYVKLQPDAGGSRFLRNVYIPNHTA